MKQFSILLFFILAVPTFCFSDSLYITEKIEIISEQGPFGDTSLTDTTKKPNKFRLAVVASSVPILTTGVFLYFQNAWWNDTLEAHGLPKPKFHFDDSKELKYALCLDKCGHFWSSQITSTAFGEMLMWAGVKRKSAKWFGAGFAVLTSGIVEVKDGMAPWWGFSLMDMSANILGAFYPVLQEYHPFFNNFTFKWSYDFFHKSYYKSMPGHENKSFMDDYDRHTYWLCTNIKGVTPKSWGRYIPGFLSFDIGLSAVGLDGQEAGKSEVFLGLGIDLSNINIKNCKLFNSKKRILNYYHLPCPAQKIYPSKVSYLLAF